MNRRLLLLIAVCFFGTFSSARAKIILPKPTDPLCAPTPTPTPTPVPSPSPSPPPAPTPIPPPFPKPPSNLPPDGPDPALSGSEILDRAVHGELPRSYLPLWHGYPWQKIPHQLVWTAYAVETLRRDGAALWQGTPTDIALYCPNYAKLTSEERLVFWARFISVLSEQESSFDPLEVTYEASIGNGVFSTGLFMLSLESSRSGLYDCTMIRVQDDLFDWRKNMTCAVRIMSALLKKDGAIAWGTSSEPSAWRGLARYWAPLREMRLKTPIGRQCLDETVAIRRPLWEKEAQLTKHPSLFDSDYHAAGESRSERFLRMVNELPLCHAIN